MEQTPASYESANLMNAIPKAKLPYDIIHTIDPILDCKDTAFFNIEETAEAMTSVAQEASSATPNNVTFEVVVPSLSTILSRRILVSGGFTVQISGNAVAAGLVFPAANQLAACAFPFNSLMDSCKVTLNGASFDMEMRSILPVVKRMYCKDALKECDGSPHELPFYANPATEATSTGRNVLQTCVAGVEDGFIPNGAYPLTLVNDPVAGAAAANGDNSVLVYIPFNEPLLLPPFTLNNKSQGLYGINKLTFLFKLGNVAQVLNWSAINITPASLNVQFAGWGNVTGGGNQSKPQLKMINYSPKSSLTLKETQAIPYYQMQSIAQTDSSINNGNSATLNLNPRQLQQMPDYIALFVRQQIDNRAAGQFDCFATINNVNFNFNNQPGLLSNYVPYDLYKISKGNGLNITYPEFAGLIGTTRGDAQLPTTGSILLLRPGSNLPVPQEYYSNNSIGQFSISGTINVTNNTGVNMSNPELVTVYFYKSIAVTRAGRTETYTGLFGKNDIMKALNKPYGEQDRDHELMYGGSFLSNVFSGIRNLASKIPKPLLQSACEKVVDKVSGSGKSAGAYSAGCTAVGSGWKDANRMSGRLQ